MSADGASARITLRTLRKWAREGHKIPMLTCYDATTAAWLWRGGLRTFLVGDTAAEFILGHDSTLPVSMAFMLEITAAVRRGAPGAFVMADMPFGSYQCGDDRAVANAARFVTRGRADAVKLEVDASFAPLVGRMASAGIPVVAHLGSRPQQVRRFGGYESAGRTRAEADAIVAAAAAMVERGAAMLLLEAVPAEVAQRIASELPQVASGRVVLIGCGAGPACHGHVVVLHDLLGLSDWQPPFAPLLGQLGGPLLAAAEAWVKKISSGEYLRHDHPYRMQG